jgi:hypothetical protein
MLIHQDTYKLVLQPVQRMVERVREMAEDPLMLAAVRLSSLPQQSGGQPSTAGGRGPGSTAAAAVDGSAVSSADGAAWLTFSSGAQHGQLMNKESSNGSVDSGWWWSRRASPNPPVPAGSKIHSWPAARVGQADNAQQLEPSGRSRQPQPSAFFRLSSPPRSSSVQLMVAGAQRLSAGVVAGEQAGCGRMGPLGRRTPGSDRLRADLPCMLPCTYLRMTDTCRFCNPVLSVVLIQAASSCRWQC